MSNIIGERIKTVIVGSWKYQILHNLGFDFQGFSGVRDCVTRTLTNEGVLSFWRGNFASVLRYFPQQALNFAFKDQIQTIFKVKPCESLTYWVKC
jgi:hypothetical protein